MNKKLVGAFLITLTVMVLTVSLSRYGFSQLAQIVIPSPSPTPTPTPTSSPTPTPSPSETPSVSKSSVPEFTLKVVGNTVKAKIKNNIGASYYNFRYKGRYETEWSYYPSDPGSVSGYNHYDAYSVPFPASNSSYTVISLYFLPTISEKSEVDIQVQALFGNYDAVPYGHFVPLPAPTYDFYFKGTTSDWSSTQTITIP